MQSRRNTGSFRDPSGYVFSRDDGIYRAIDADCEVVLRDLDESGLLAQLTEDGLVVQTRFVDGGLLESLSKENPGYSCFLSHEKIAPISYPYEWSTGMLADAAILTLNLQMRLAQAGYALKDATAYNIQFVNGRPVFIDLASIEKPSRQDLWFALGQFQRMFLFPLLLCRHCGWDIRSYFLGSLDGRSAEQVERHFGRISRFRPALLLDLTLPLMFERRSEKKNAHRSWEQTSTGNDPKAQLINLKRLKGKIRSLADGYKTHGVWSDYTKTCSYDSVAESSKKKCIGSFLKTTPAATVLDVGCNTGDYSRLAAEHGARVVAVDADHDAVELLYRQLRTEGKSILPMVVDAANPSPAIGFMNQERSAFLERISADCVLALAVMHHLLVSANLSMLAIRDLFYHLSQRDLILEFVPTDDSMFQRLIHFRVNLFSGVTLENCLAVFQERFELLQKTPIEGTVRTLIFFRKKP
jgi:2-polyprenyl-3-methyl-5-hydroxy-6-metoxy-1,4-benzoquinol methylase